MWSRHLWTSLLSSENLEARITNIPERVHISLFATHSDVSLFDSDRLSRLEHGHSESLMNEDAYTRTVGLVDSNIDDVLFHYRQLISLYLFHLADYGDLFKDFFHIPHLIYALFYYIVSPQQSVRDAITALIKGLVILISIISAVFKLVANASFTPTDGLNAV